MVGRDGGEGVAGHCADGDAVDLDVGDGVTCRRGNSVALVRSAIHSGDAGRSDAAAGSGRGGNRVGYDGKGCRDSVVGGDGGEGVGCDCADGDAVNLDVGNGIAGRRGNGVVLAGAAIHGGGP